MNAAPRIAVLAALGRNPVSQTVRPNRDDLVALELARRLKGSITLLHAGDDISTLGDYFAYGAETLDLIPLLDGQDVAAVLAEHAAGYDIVLAGARSEGGEGSGMVPYLVAQRLGLPIVTHVLDLKIVDGHAEVTQGLSKGRRRHVRVRLPAVIAAHPNAPFKPRYAHARRAGGEFRQHPVSEVPNNKSVWSIDQVAKRPVKFKAAETKSGHARMLSAIVAETKSGAVINTGTPAQKAQAILAYLREHKLIDW